MVQVMLIDTNDDVLLVECEDMSEAEAVGRAAVWNAGGVSAYRVPDDSVKASEGLIEALRDGGDIDAVREAVE